jgi:hypothetical protein
MKNPDQVACATSKVNRRIGFYIHLTVFVIVNALLIVVNLLTSAKYLWFVWPLLGWSAGILLHALLMVGLPRMCGMRRKMIERELSTRTSDHREST